jgi:mannose-1-phosphate guanylyltransferase
MEKIDRLNVVPASFGWSDLGSWQTAWELAPKDDHGNAAPEATLFVDARRNLVRDLSSRAGQKTIALVGVQDLCVVETDDALLIIPRERCQDVRLVVEELKRRGDTEKF